MKCGSITLPWYRPSDSRRGVTSRRWLIASAVIALFVCLPFAIILVEVLSQPAAEWLKLLSPLNLHYLSNTITLVLGVCVLTLLFGVAPAWLVSVYRFPGSRVLSWALVLPLAIPPYIAAFAYTGVFDLTGPLNRLAGTTIDIMTLPGLVLIMGAVLYPYVYLLTRVTFARQSAQLLEVSQVSGKTPIRTFLAAALPLARPAMAGGVTLALMELLNDYGAAHYFGVDTFTTGIFRMWFASDDVAGAMRMCVCLVVVVFVILTVERAQRGKARFDTGSSGMRTKSPQRLTGGRAFAAVAVCAVPLVLGFLIPFGQLAVWAAQTFRGSWNAEFMGLALHSILLATSAALVTVAAALVLVYTVRLHPTRAIRMASRLATIGYCVPGAIIAIGVMAIGVWATRLRGMADSGIVSGVSGAAVAVALCLLVFAYVVRFLALAFNPLESGFERVSRSLDDSSRTLGMGPTRTLLKVNLPLVRGAVVCAAILVFVDTLKELPLTLILRPFNFDTLATHVFELANEESLALSANGALLIIAAGLIPICILNRVMTPAEPRRQI